MTIYVSGKMLFRCFKIMIYSYNLNLIKSKKFEVRKINLKKIGDFTFYKTFEKIISLNYIFFFISLCYVNLYIASLLTTQVAQNG